MLNALDEETKNFIFPDNTIPGLSAIEMTILAESKEFFEEGAVHYITDTLRSSEHVERKYKERMKENRYQAFCRVLTAKKKPETGDDPYTVFGISRDDKTKEAWLDKLRPQFETATIRCYEEGYKFQSPAWDIYTKEPVYWFQTLCNFYRTDEFLGPWKLKSLNEDDKEKISSEIGHKLTLLKHAAENNPTFAEAGKKLDVDVTLNYLQGEHVCAFSYAQVIDDEFAKKATDVS